jgi:hypothetical protein
MRLLTRQAVRSHSFIVRDYSVSLFRRARPRGLALSLRDTARSCAIAVRDRLYRHAHVILAQRLCETVSIFLSKNYVPNIFLLMVCLVAMYQCSERSRDRFSWGRERRGGWDGWIHADLDVASWQCCPRSRSSCITCLQCLCFSARALCSKCILKSVILTTWWSCQASLCPGQIHMAWFSLVQWCLLEDCVTAMRCW